MILTYKYRIKDGTVGKHLDRHSRACNFVWNYCCQIQREAQSRWKAGRAVKWPTAFDLIKLCTGAAADLSLHSDTVQTICRQFAASRDAKHKCPRFRASGGPKKSLGWIPFIPRAVKVDGAHVVYLKRKFHFWKSRDLGGQFKAGCFTQDARGRWYVAFQCEAADELSTGNGEIGIDLGLKALATCSDGMKGSSLAALPPISSRTRRCAARRKQAPRQGDSRQDRRTLGAITSMSNPQESLATTN